MHGHRYPQPGRGSRRPDLVTQAPPMEPLPPPRPPTLPPGRARGRRGHLLLTVALALLAGACTTAGDPADPRPPAREPTTATSAEPPSDAPDSFALALGLDADDPAAARQLMAYDLIVVDGTETTPATVAALQAGGATVLGYLSVGTLEPGRPWFAEAQGAGWLLERWERWDEWYADLRQPGLRALLLDVAQDVLDAGFDGLFLDNTDLPEVHPEQATPMRELVADLDDLVGPQRRLFAQNGDPQRTGLDRHLDGWNREDVTFTFDPDADGYLPVDPDDQAEAIEQLRALGDAGLVVTATDYLAGTDEMLIEEAAAVACGAGALPFVADIDLTQLPDEPLTCDGRSG